MDYRLFTAEKQDSQNNMVNTKNNLLIKLRKRFHYVGRSLVDFIFPLCCLSCRKKINMSFYFAFCKSCFKRLIIIKKYSCSRCGRPMDVSSYSEGILCHQCREGKTFFDRSLSALCFTEEVKRALYAFKYHGKEHYGYFLSCFMAAKLKRSFGREWLEGAVIVPVPLFYKKQRERGYNQSEVLSYHISDTLHLNGAENILMRTVHSPSQTQLKRKERQKNIKGTFSIKKKVSLEGRSVLLVDDVMTTGATLNECARILKESGAKEVIGITLASVTL